MPEETLKLLLNICPDTVISFQGWTWGDGVELLFVLKKHRREDLEYSWIRWHYHDALS